MNILQKIQKAQEEWINSLEDDQPNHNSNSVQEATTGLEQSEDVDIRIFCDGAMNREENKLGIGYIVYTRQNTVLLAKISKCLLLKKLWSWPPRKAGKSDFLQ